MYALHCAFNAVHTLHQANLKQTVRHLVLAHDLLVPFRAQQRLQHQRCVKLRGGGPLVYHLIRRGRGADGWKELGDGEHACRMNEYGSTPRHDRDRLHVLQRAEPVIRVRPADVVALSEK